MASETSSIPANGSYTPHGGYDQNANGYASSNANPQSAYSAATPSSTNNATSTAGTSDIPKDEVGWYFVEQYYTTLSRSPEKLYLFYNKRSQFVLGQETDKVAVSVGQRAINERIKELDFQDCKVRVTNVDSQSSDANIVIQVIGEISNKAAPHKKFTQTFVLAGQTNGYFVLNDIFRYIIEEENEAEPEQTQHEAFSIGHEEPEPVAAQEPVPETLTSSRDPVAIEQDVKKLNKELEEKVLKDAAVEEAEEPSPAVNGVSAEPEQELLHAEEAPAAAVAAPVEDVAPAPPSPAAPDVPDEEKPKDPVSTPAVSSPVKQTAQPAVTPNNAAAPSKPAAPKTWANLVAANRIVTPAVPAPQPVTSPAPSQAKSVPAQAQATAAAAAPTPASAAAATPQEDSTTAEQQDEWTSVGGDHKKQQSKAQAGPGAQEGPQSRAYIKNVHDTVDAKDLRTLLEKFGKIGYFDVSRQKNCAFVDFETPEGYKAAVEANPHQLGNDRIIVEERRLKPGSYPYVQRGGIRGGRGGTPNQGSGRGSFQGRGGFPSRGRGGPAARGGRGAAQTA